MPARPTATRIHLSSGIFNLSPRANHPVRTAERVAMLDHLSEGRFEFGTGRGAGSHEVARVRSHRADQVCFGMPTNLAYDTAYTDRSTP